MKHLILAASAAMMLAACGQKADKASPSDSTTVKDTLVTTEAKTDFASPDLQMHGLKGQVKQVSTTEYESDKNGKQDFERNKTLLTFDPQGHWTGNENAQFKTGNITRDKDGRISKLTYSYLINKEEDYGYQYDYTYKYDAAGRLKAMGEEYVGELSGGFEYLFTYDDAGEVISYTQDGGGDGVEVESTYTITVLDRDGHGNWTRRLQKEVCTTEEYDSDGQPDKSTYTEYVLQVRKIEYY